MKSGTVEVSILIDFDSNIFSSRSFQNIHPQFTKNIGAKKIVKLMKTYYFQKHLLLFKSLFDFKIAEI